ncbi:glycosyltransferase family 4 protein [Bacteroides nordii]|uniref:glycosyltransferase family 4 protein n=1 Tax=Bacteroides nordii TaxID=291645 RepID=UPI00203FE7DF|nr:glycosyltransferase [Bacteroides nordii]GFZ39534.1 hypothetical protein BANORC5_15690 [Bacteroides nordii]
MKVIIFANLTYKPIIGGVENSLHYMSQSALEMGYESVIYVSDLSKNKNERLPLFERNNRINIYRFRKIHTVNLFFFLDSVFAVYSAWIGYRQLKKKYGKNVRIVARHHIMVCAAILAGMENVAYLVPSMVKGLNDRRREGLSFKERFKEWLLINMNIRLDVWLQNIAFNRCADCFAFSLNMKSQIDKLVSRRTVSVVKPGVDTNVFKFDPENRWKCKIERGLENTFIFLCLGRIIEAKGFSDVIWAYDNLPDEVKRKSKVLIVGDGPDKPRLVKIVKEKKLIDRILFFDATSYPYEFYNLSDCFMMTSRYEAFGQTLLEAMSCGLPVVGYKSDGNNILTATNELVIEGENGLLCAFDVLELSNSMATICNKSNDELEKFALSNIDRMKYEFNWERLIDDTYA